MRHAGVTKVPTTRIDLTRSFACVRVHAPIVPLSEPSDLLVKVRRGGEREPRGVGVADSPGGSPVELARELCCLAEGPLRRLSKARRR